MIVESSETMTMRSNSGCTNSVRISQPHQKTKSRLPLIFDNTTTLRDYGTTNAIKSISISSTVTSCWSRCYDVKKNEIF